MNTIRKFLDDQEKHFTGDGKLKPLYPLYEAIDTFLYTPGQVAKGQVHVRDGIDLKRTMITVAIALFPCILMALYNTGLQAQMGLESIGAYEVAGWRGQIFHSLGFRVNSSNIVSCFMLGALYFLPIFIVTNIVGGTWEGVFASIRGHEINEGFLVTGILFPLTLPATIPLWQVALGVSFGVVLGKEVYGGTGKNFLNIALTSRAFLYFAYPGEISGDSVWVAADGYSGATLLSQAASSGVDGLTYSWWNAFLGFVPGSMGETSALAALIGAGFLILSGIANWRIIASLVASTVLFSLMLNMIGSDTNPMFSLTPAWHLVVGGFAFGAVFMATDPVSATMTNIGHYFYGALIGVMTVLVRVINPAFPEGIMLAILFGNVFAPLIDYFVMNANINRRKKGYAKG